MASIVLPRFPSTESLRPEDAPVRLDADQHASLFGERNLEILHALANKDELLPNRGDGVHPNADPLRADEIVQLLLNQSERRRRKIFDDEAAMVCDIGQALLKQKSEMANPDQMLGSRDKEALCRAFRRRQELNVYGKNSKFNTPLEHFEWPQKAWSPIDEAEIRLASISERGDFDYTGRVNRVADNQLAQQLEDYFMTGVLPDTIGLVFLNALFGSLHVIHVLESNDAKLRDWRSNFTVRIPRDADGLIQAVRDMRIEHSIAPERTKIVDLLVCGLSLGGRNRMNTTHFDHLTDTLQNMTDNAHEDDLLPVRFIALAHKYRHSLVARSCMYNFPPLDEEQVRKIALSRNNSLHNLPPPALIGFDCVKSFEGLRDQLDWTESRPPAKDSKVKVVHDSGYETHAATGGSKGKCVEESGYESPPPELEPVCLLTTESLFANNPSTKAGREPYLLSRSVPVPDLQPSPNRALTPPESATTPLKAPLFPRRASELPTGKYCSSYLLGFYTLHVVSAVHSSFGILNVSNNLKAGSFLKLYVYQTRTETYK
jgi:hypothetical protein